MATPVTLPRLGESVTEGTITRWLKKEGDWVEEDEPLVEISTDKIDTELPSPAKGVLTSIRVGEDQTVDVGTEIAVIDETAAKPGEAPVAEQPAPSTPPPAQPAPSTPPRAQPEPAARERTQPAAHDGHQGRGGVGVLSPLVRKLAKEHQIDLAQVPGTGEGGRVTKRDVLDFVGRRTRPAGTGAPQFAAPPAEAASTPRPSAFSVPASPSLEVPFTRIRKTIAEHMTRSRHTAAHVTDIIEVDMTAVARVRERAKEAFRRTEGFGLTYLPFIAKATVEALRIHPQFNAHLGEASATLLRQVNLGIAVGRDEGLIVPVVKSADAMNLIGLARGINDVATRARTKGGLTPDDVADGTFTVTNYGSFGAVLDTPIINQPQVAILGMGAVVKRPAVVTVNGEDVIAIRHMMYLCLSYDHRWIDGHVAAQFNATLKRILETEDFGRELPAP